MQCLQQQLRAPAFQKASGSRCSDSESRSLLCLSILRWQKRHQVTPASGSISCKRIPDLLKSIK